MLQVRILKDQSPSASMMSKGLTDGCTTATLVVWASGLSFDRFWTLLLAAIATSTAPLPLSLTSAASIAFAISAALLYCRRSTTACCLLALCPCSLLLPPLQLRHYCLRAITSTMSTSYTVATKNSNALSRWRFSGSLPLVRYK